MSGGAQGIHEEPPTPTPSPHVSYSSGLPSNGSPNGSSERKRKKSVRFSNAVTVKVVPRIYNTAPSKPSFITGTLLDPTTRTFRIILMFLLCFQTVGCTFSSGSPNILRAQISKEVSVSNQEHYLAMFMAIDSSSFLLVFISGYLLDKTLTVGKWAILFSATAVAGQLLFSIGVWIPNIFVVIGGRIIFEVSSGSLYVIQCVLMTRWLVGVEMGLGVGLALTASEVTLLLADWMNLQSVRDYGVFPALLIGALICVGSLSATLLAAALDAWGTDQLPKPPNRSMVYLQKTYYERRESASSHSTPPSALASYSKSTSPPPSPALLPSKSPPASPPLPPLSALLTDEAWPPLQVSEKSGDLHSDDQENFDGSEGNRGEGEYTRRNIVSLLIVAIFLVVPAGALNRGPDGLAALLKASATAAPVVGWALDRIGRASIFLVIGIVLQLGALMWPIIYTAVGTPPIYDEFLVTAIILGIAWAVIMCSGIPCCALLVPTAWAGRVFAGLTMVHSISLTAAQFYTYTRAMLIWIPTLVSTAIGLCLIIMLYRTKSILNMNAHDIRRIVGYTKEDEERAPLLSPESTL